MRISSPPAVVQQAWAEFIIGGGVELLQSEATAAVHARAAFEAAAGKPLHAYGHSQGPSLLAVLPPGRSSGEIAARLRTAGVLVGLGEDFLAPLPSVRICFTGVTPEQARDAGRRFRGILEPYIR